MENTLGDNIIMLLLKLFFIGLLIVFFIFNVHIVTSDDGGRSNAAKIYAHQMVRTDSREQTLHAFLPPKDQTTEGKR